MATIKDVAKHAGVSVATVSCCLTGAKPVKPETKIRVMQAVEALHYIPNAAARSLKMTGSKKIGVVLPDLNDEFYAEMLKGISLILQEENYMVSILFTYGNPKMECEKLDALINENVAGILLVTCQPENTAFFQSRIYNYEIPVVFMHHKPRELNVDHVSVDNHKTVKFLADSLLERGYEDIVLVMGAMRFSAEEACFRGLRDAFADHARQLPEHQIFITNMTKENAFRAAMEACRDRTPDAILTTSGQMAKGIREALDLMGLRVPEDLLVAALGEESWNRTNHLPNVLYSARAADALGTGAARLLLEKIAAPQREPQSVVYTDNLLYRRPDIPPKRPRAPEAALRREDEDALRILLLDTPSCRALELLSRYCTNMTGVPLRCAYGGIRNLLDAIKTDAASEHPRFDIYAYDTPWTADLANGGYFADLTEFVQTELEAHCVFRRFWENAQAGGRYLGIPFIGGTQLMFYRRDLFEKPSVMKAYKERCGESLRPPKTWQEYNRVAEFFTRRCNPDSPTEYGTAISGISSEFLAPELMIRLWAFGGRIWDGALRPCVNSPQNLRAFKSILETFRYQEKSPFGLDAEAVTAAFCEGKAAMIIAFSEYAGEIRRALNQKVISAIGYDRIPGAPMRAGWSFGMNKKAPKERAYRFFRWLLQNDTSCYYTILGGQSTTTTPYNNSEIIGLYPWMELTKTELDHYDSRSSPPPRRNGSLIPVDRIEDILCLALREVYEKKTPIRDALDDAQQRMEALFHQFGY